MSKLFLAFLMLASVARADVVLIENSAIKGGRGMWIGPVPTQVVERVDLGRPGVAGFWTHNEYFVPTTYPAFVDAETRREQVAPEDIGIDADARAEKRNPYRKALREARKAWRQTVRDTAKSLGLPGAAGDVWSVETVYSSAESITNAATRRDLTIRIIAADLALTRSQLAVKYPHVDWWWLEQQLTGDEK